MMNGSETTRLHNSSIIIHQSSFINHHSSFINHHSSIIIHHCPRRFVELRLDRKLRRRLDASDVVQETQLEAASRLADFLERSPMPFHLWLRKTAYQRLLMIHRQHLDAARRDIQREVPRPPPCRGPLRIAGGLGSDTLWPGLRTYIEMLRIAGGLGSDTLWRP